MANENNDISDIVKKCKILLLDIEGTTTSISFVKDKLFPYAAENVKEFLSTQWETDDVKEVVSALRKLSLEDQEKSVDGVVVIPGEDASKDEQIEGLVKNVKWQMSADRKAGALKQLQGLIWKQGYDKGDIKGHVYDDVSPALDLWRSVEDQKVYIYSSGSVQAQKLLFGQSQSGDLLKYINGHFDTAVGAKQEAASYATIVEKIGCASGEILFLTDILKEAEAARASGLNVALVSREGNSPLPDAIDFPIIYSLAQLEITNKRKPDDQDVQPAKVPKTDITADVKTNIDTENGTVPVIEKVLNESEKMEVEEETNAKDAPTEKIDNVATVDKIETIVEDVTDSNEVTETPIADVKPIIEESVDEKRDKETEMEIEPVQEAVSVTKDDVKVENGENDSPIAEKKTTVITIIEDVTNGKEAIPDTAEIIEDIVPIVEEPAISDMEILQNAGDVLEKECDEILSKVQDVTNLDNIPVKPLLNTITEELMDAENTNDIVDRILDSEQELEIKQSAENADEKTTKEISNDEIDPPVTEEKTDPPKVIAVDNKPTSVDDAVKDDVKQAENGGENSTEKIVESSTESKENTTVNVSDIVKDDNAVKPAVNEAEKETSQMVDTPVTDIVKNENIDNVKEVAENSNGDVKADSDTKVESEKCSTDVQLNNVPKKEKETTVGVLPDKEKAIEKQESDVGTRDIAVKNEESRQEDEVSKISSEDNKIGSNENKVENKVIEESERKEANSKDQLTDNVINSESSTDVAEEKKTDKIVEPSESPMETEHPEKVITDKENQVKPDTAKVECPSENSTTAGIVSEKDQSIDSSSMETDTTTATESKPENAMETETVEAKKTSLPEVEKTVTSETQMNGKATNGDTDMVSVNGDANKAEELTARLSMENGKDSVNGANGDAETEKIELESSAGTEIQDIKVKTVATDEPRTEPIEQPMEA